MTPANIYQLEVKSSLSSGRSLFMKLGFTFLLGFPFVLVDLPVRIQAAGLVMILLFAGFLGAAITCVHRRSEGHLTKLKLLPLPRWLIYTDLTLASAAVDILQMGLLLGLFLTVRGDGSTAGSVIVMAGLFLSNVLLLDGLGVGLGALARSNSEVHLAGALGVGVIAFLSGLFPVPARLQGFVSATSRFSPPAHLMNALTAAGAASETTPPPVSLSAAWAVVTAGVVGVLLLRHSCGRGGPA
jgi:hypothetical protein